MHKTLFLLFIFFISKNAHGKNIFSIDPFIGITHNEIFREPDLKKILYQRDANNFKYFPKFGYVAGVKISKSIGKNIFINSGLYFEKYNVLTKQDSLYTSLFLRIAHPAIEIHESQKVIKFPLLVSYKIKKMEFYCGLSTTPVGWYSREHICIHNEFFVDQKNELASTFETSIEAGSSFMISNNFRLSVFSEIKFQHLNYYRFEISYKINK